MTPTHAQKSAIGVQFLEAIKARIETRSAAKKFADSTAEIERSTLASCVQANAKAWLKNHAIKGAFKSADRQRNYYDNANHEHVRIIVKGAMFKIDLTEFPQGGRAIMAAEKGVVDIDKKRGNLCEEIVFLGGLESSRNVSSFQAYVCRLWSPEKKDSVLPEFELRKLVQGFIDSLRPKVCLLK